MSKPDIAVGTVELELSGGTVTLTPTPRALMEISKRFGSLTSALQQIVLLNAEALVFVVRTGGRVSDKRQKTLEEEIFAFGITKLTDPLGRYMRILLNGGRPVDDGDEEPTDGEGAPGNG